MEPSLREQNTLLQEIAPEVCAHQRIADQVAATPQAVALSARATTLSYLELNRRANQLAHVLQALGVGPDRPVALCLERSPEQVVALLGILKAGGAYVPLDPAYPPERLRFMLQDTQASVLLTRQELAPLFRDIRSARIVCLDTEAEALARQRSAEPVSRTTPDHLAYIIYTSGSTGQPKGVQITHRSLHNLICWHQQAFAITADDRATQIASPAFDAAGWELWPYLTCGACVLFPDEETRVSPVCLRDWLVEQEISITFLPTPLAECMLTLDWPRRLALRFLLTGADTLHQYPPADLPFSLINNYGPTEATVVATSGRVPALDAHEPPALGWPIAHTQIFLLDEQLQEVPAGQPGEVYIAGAGLARGYHNQPALTAERFLVSPFDPCARLYKTGDLARRLPDGQLAFLGRADHQIKLRGYRIEPDEIVTALNRHPAITSSLVLAREDLSGEKRLVAYIAGTPGPDVTAYVLREYLARSLPEYMLPALFVQLPALPLLPNGKLDRAALPAPDPVNTLREQAIVCASTPTQARLVEIVAPLLGLGQLGIDDNFFMLGGHSLLATQIIMYVARTFSVTLTLLTLFEAPTIRLLAAEVEHLILARLETLSEEEARQLLAEQSEERSPVYLEELR
jgi:amino acid adenylation domain-containing protein